MKIARLTKSWQNAPVDDTFAIEITNISETIGRRLDGQGKTLLDFPVSNAINMLCYLAIQEIRTDLNAIALKTQQICRHIDQTSAIVPILLYGLKYIYIVEVRNFGESSVDEGSWNSVVPTDRVEAEFVRIVDALA